MKIKKLNLSKYFLIVFGIILVDQILKVYIKLNYSLTFYGDPAIIDYGWFRLLFIENRGMAWGAKLNDFIPFIDDKFAKLFLTIFRIIAIGFIFYWLRKSIKEGANSILKISLALILAGAIGNVIDSVFYGYLFTESYFEVATFSPGNGYESLFFGNVVDMFQFPLFTWTWPDWIPSIGGNEFTFFEPVFNIADSSISIGIFLMIIFNNTIFPKN
ncbi:MAG: lipoprotein signal peptidase [Flavobacteriaceae bacterium]|nr:lipoprotein signal peptidase [Flavobacteriaceae bacterium]MBL6681112.1 lipoprotein signal peptidase [Flavobacteriaceae bacterium]